MLGEPYLNVVAVRSDDPRVNIYSVQNAMTKHNWELNALQHPPSFHIALTEANYKRAMEIPKLVTQAIQKVIVLSLILDHGRP